MNSSCNTNNNRNNFVATRNIITPNANMKIKSLQGKIKNKFMISKNNHRNKKEDLTIVDKINRNLVLDKNKVIQIDICINNIKTKSKNNKKEKCTIPPRTKYPGISKIKVHEKTIRSEILHNACDKKKRAHVSLTIYNIHKYCICFNSK